MFLTWLLIETTYITIQIVHSNVPVSGQRLKHFFENSLCTSTTNTTQTAKLSGQAGFNGTITAGGSGAAPFYLGSCTAVSCPEHSTGVSDVLVGVLG